MFALITASLWQRGLDNGRLLARHVVVNLLSRVAVCLFLTPTICDRRRSTLLHYLLHTAVVALAGSNRVVALFEGLCDVQQLVYASHLLISFIIVG